MANSLEDEMRLTFAIIDLKRDLVEERTRADTANKALALATRQTTDLAEENEAALAMRDEAKIEVEQAKLESNHFREELRKAQVLVEKLTNDLHEARNLRPVLDQTAVNQLHATITARDSKIEQLVDKYDRLQSEHFTMQRQANKSSEERQSYQVKNENLAIELRDLGAKLTAAETSRNR
jgi:chromosome segregation ATPase